MSGVRSGRSTASAKDQRRAWEIVMDETRMCHWWSEMRETDSEQVEGNSVGRRGMKGRKRRWNAMFCQGE